MTSHTPASRAISPIRSVSALGTTTAWSASSAYQSSSSSQIRAVSIHTGVPGTKTSGKTTTSAPSTLAVAARSATRSIVAEASIRTGAACTAATRSVVTLCWVFCTFSFGAAMRWPGPILDHPRETLNVQVCSQLLVRCAAPA
jgi:hypothetical protein